MSEKLPPVEHLATLYEITHSLNSTLDLEEVLNYVMDRVIQVTGAERGFLMLMDEETGSLNFQVARGIDQKDLDNPKFSISRTIVGEVRRTGNPLLTDNASDQYANQESVVMMALRSILCVPIYVRERMIGLVYVDNRMFSGVFNEQHLELISSFASQAGFAIENARLYQIAIKQGRMQRELEMAHRIQRGLLPTDFPVLDGYEVGYYWDSAREVAGDFYDCFPLHNGEQMGVIIADVSDKGAPAALFMAVVSRLIRDNAMTSDTPIATLLRTNSQILGDAEQSGMFVTVYHAVFAKGGYAQCVNAGHNLPLIWRARNGTIEWLPRGGTALGWFDTINLEIVEYQLEPGDVFVMYTDGLTEAENIKGEPFEEGRLARVVSNAAGQVSAQEMVNLIIEAVADFVGDVPPFDDKTVMVVRYIGA